jgi:hypothetical protein
MNVARQFIAWYPYKKGNRPVGHGMIGSDRRATIRTTNQPGGNDQTVPYGTDSRLNLFQAMNCLATIIQSLRDISPYRRFAVSPFRPFAKPPPTVFFLSVNRKFD